MDQLAGNVACRHGGPAGRPHRTGAPNNQVLATRSPPLGHLKPCCALRLTSRGVRDWLPMLMIGNPHYALLARFQGEEIGR
jgi:hypothetical protein